VGRTDVKKKRRVKVVKIPNRRKRYCKKNHLTLRIDRMETPKRGKEKGHDVGEVGRSLQKR